MRVHRRRPELWTACLLTRFWVQYVKLWSGSCRASLFFPIALVCLWWNLCQAYPASFMSARDAAQLGRQRARLCNRVGSCFFADEFPRGCSPGLCSAWCGALNCMCQDWGAFVVRHMCVMIRFQICSSVWTGSLVLRPAELLDTSMFPPQGAEIGLLIKLHPISN
jgi:hypothetical protein